LASLLTYLIAFAIPCSAQLAIDMGILGSVGFKAFLIAYGTLAILEIGVGFLLNMLIKDDSKSAFILMGGSASNVASHTAYIQTAASKQVEHDTYLQLLSPAVSRHYRSPFT